MTLAVFIGTCLGSGFVARLFAWGMGEMFAIFGGALRDL